MPLRVFLSYRRDDTSGHSGRLYDSLARRLGERNVFQDVMAIDPGVDFGDAIVDALAHCDAVLAVIGPTWATASTSVGARRLDLVDDYVRLELAAALDRDARVIPVLVGGAVMPTIADLPEALQSLADRQAVVLHDASWQQDVDALVSRLRGQPPARNARRWQVAAGAASLAIILVAGGLWLITRRGGQTGGGHSTCPDSAGTRLELASPLPGADVPRSNDAGPFRFEVEDASYRQLAPGSWLVLLRTVMTNEHPSDHFANAHYRYDSLDVDGHPAEVSCYTDLNPVDGIVGPDEKATALVGFVVTRDPHGLLQLRLEHQPDPVNLDLTSP